MYMYMYIYVHCFVVCLILLASFFLPSASLINIYIGCAVLLCFVVCLTLLASFFLPSHFSLTCTCLYVYIHM